MEIRFAREEDRLPLARLHAAVAAERQWIGAEPPVDIEARAAHWDLERTFVATIDNEIVGLLFVIESGFGFGEIGMSVAANARRHGVGTGLMQTAIDWARAQRLHKLTLDVFPHNTAAIALYERFGFIVEGRRVKQIRRQSGELWDLIEMGLLLEKESRPDGAA
jgi:putative acetyltransferase